MVGGLILAGLAGGEPPPRAPLDALWEKHMLEGTFVFIEVHKSKITAREKHPPPTVDPKDDEPTFGVLMSHPISVSELGEGLFGNGGWILQGGLLRRINDDSSTIELYGKRVVRQFPHFRILPHRDPPMEVGYEFFLLRRKPGTTRAVIIRQWTFLPDEVVLKDVGHGGRYPNVRCILQYDATTRNATVTVTGLKRPFEERIDLSSGLGSFPR